MENADLKKLITALGGLGLLLVLLVSSTIIFVILVQTRPDFLISTEIQVEEPEITQAEMDDRMEDGVHVATGFVEGEGLTMVINNCTNCHSAKLVTQNRFTKEGWIQVIRWMQETQGLWDLGPNEAAIVEYLSTHYAPEPRGRRKPLEVEWYTLE